MSSRGGNALVDEQNRKKEAAAKRKSKHAKKETLKAPDKPYISEDEVDLQKEHLLLLINLKKINVHNFYNMEEGYYTTEREYLLHELSQLKLDKLASFDDNNAEVKRYYEYMNNTQEALILAITGMKTQRNQVSTSEFIQMCCTWILGSLLCVYERRDTVYLPGGRTPVFIYAPNGSNAMQLIKMNALKRELVTGYSGYGENKKKTFEENEKYCELLGRLFVYVKSVSSTEHRWFDIEEAWDYMQANFNECVYNIEFNIRSWDDYHRLLREYNAHSDDIEAAKKARAERAESARKQAEAREKKNNERDEDPDPINDTSHATESKPQYTDWNDYSDAEEDLVENNRKGGEEEAQNSPKTKDERFEQVSKTITEKERQIIKFQMDWIDAMIDGTKLGWDPRKKEKYIQRREALWRWFEKFDLGDMSGPTRKHLVYDHRSIQNLSQQAQTYYACMNATKKRIKLYIADIKANNRKNPISTSEFHEMWKAVFSWVLGSFRAELSEEDLITFKDNLYLPRNPETGRSYKASDFFAPNELKTELATGESEYKQTEWSNLRVHYDWLRSFVQYFLSLSEFPRKIDLKRYDDGPVETFRYLLSCLKDIEEMKLRGEGPKKHQHSEADTPRPKDKGNDLDATEPKPQLDDQDAGNADPEPGDVLPEYSDSDSDAPIEDSHVTQPPNGNGDVNPGGNRRDETDKKFDPAKEYIPDDTSVLKEYNGRVLPPLRKQLPRDPVTGGVAWDEIPAADLSIMIRRMIAMYLRNKRVYAAIIVRQNKYKQLLDENVGFDRMELKSHRGVLSQNHRP